MVLTIGGGPTIAPSFDRAETFTPATANSTTAQTVLDFPLVAPGRDFYVVAFVPIIGSTVSLDVVELTIVNTADTAEEVGYWHGNTYGTTDTISRTAQTVPALITGKSLDAAITYRLRIARLAGSGTVKASPRSTTIPISMMAFLADTA